MPSGSVAERFLDSDGAYHAGGGDSHPRVQGAPMRRPASLSTIRAFSTLAMMVASACVAAQTAIVDAIEFYNASLDHYFVTSIPIEIQKLDAGFFQGWARTGLSFKVYVAGTVVPGAVPVCRFYGSPSAGLDSHFYSASPAECADVKQKYPGVWIPESDNVFEVLFPDVASGACPANSVPIYRAWNNRTDENHRYTTDAATQQSMIAKGYIAEGYGPAAMPVAMCSPSAVPVSAVPVCAPTASAAAPYIGTSITLLAHCSGSPTSFAWMGCTSASNACTATAMAPGVQTYTVVASNASGSSAPASVAVSWQQLPQPPVCSLFVTANSDLPVIGSLAVLTTACIGAPSSYTWTGCVSAGATCPAHSMVPGLQSYSVIGINAGGPGAPASATINWQSTPSPAPGFCGQFPSYLFTNVGWAGARIVSGAFSDDPGFAWNGAWVARLTVPSSATSGRVGSISAAEYNGPPTSRQITLSRVPCDFRANDPTGVNGPVATNFGITTTVRFSLGVSVNGYPALAPGQTYYVNMRNWQPESSSISCDPARQRCDAFMDLTLP